MARNCVVCRVVQEVRAERNRKKRECGCGTREPALKKDPEHEEAEQRIRQPARGGRRLVRPRETIPGRPRRIRERVGSDEERNQHDRFPDRVLVEIVLMWGNASDARHDPLFPAAVDLVHLQRLGG